MIAVRAPFSRALVGLAPPKSTRAWEPTLSWNHPVLNDVKGYGAILGGLRERRANETFPRSLRLGRNHFPQFLNSSLKSALFALVILVPLRQTGHLALESLKP